AHSEGLAKGSVYVNDCTEGIFNDKNKIISLLPIGITKVEGKFSKGDIIEIKNEKAEKIGFGVAQYGHEKAQELIGTKNSKPIIHYDYMFIE
ncbi:MAG: glutamate 5-kinase, partial [Candidatus Pacebacteria bacterium]|nr:glutamate 5-kinase [Candidatus Paceibacterota bacterium]